MNKMRNVNYNALKIKIADSGFSIRCLNCLSKLNDTIEDSDAPYNYGNSSHFKGKKKVYTLGDLIKYHPKELLMIDTFGKKSLNEIIDVLDEYGLFLGMCLDESDSSLDWFAKELYEKFEIQGDFKVFDEILTKAKKMQKTHTIYFTLNYLKNFRDMGNLSNIENFYKQQIKKSE
jgi:hypothetical protein